MYVAKTPTMTPYQIITVIISLSSIQFFAQVHGSYAQSENPTYEPLYITFNDEKFELFDGIEYNYPSVPITAQPLGRGLFVACPKSDDTTRKLLQISAEIFDNVTIRCEQQVTFVVEKHPHSEHQMIGFMVYWAQGNSQEISPFKDIYPKTYYPVPLVEVIHRTAEDKISVTTWHTIRFGKLLPPESPNTENQYPFPADQEPYRTAYSILNQEKILNSWFQDTPPSTLIKLQLAPEADFYFQPWKMASASNINSTPMWRHLAPQWYQLEVFVRRVAQILDNIRVITGGTDVFTKTDDQSKGLFMLDSQRLPVYKYLYKAISFNQKFNDSWHRYGILFVMHNDPTNEPNAKPICNPMTSDINKDIIQTDDYSDEGNTTDENMPSKNADKVPGNVVDEPVTDEDEDTTHQKDDFAEQNGWDFLKDLQLQSRIYACPITSDSLERVRVQSLRKYIPFDLHNIKRVVRDDKGNESQEDVNVYELMKRAQNEVVPRQFRFMNSS